MLSKPCEIFVFISHESIINIIYFYYISITMDYVTGYKNIVKISASLDLF